MLTRKISLFQGVLLSGFTGIAAFASTAYYFSHQQNTTDEITPNCAVKRIYLHDGNFTSPLLLVDMLNESEMLLGVKAEITNIVNAAVEKGIINDAGVYIRQLNTGNWVSINGGTGFHPGSLIKVPIMITYLRQSMNNPELMDKKITFQPPPNMQIPSQTFEIPSKIKPGGSYTIRTLIEEMVTKSDNYATTALLMQMNPNEFKKTFTDIGLPEPPERDMNFKITPIDYSRFFRVLYNATYIGRDNSELALTLLSKSTFQNGIVNGINENVQVAHKFGEFNDGPYKELHEAGIIYINKDPYLVTIMSKGNKIDPMPDFISDITKTILNRIRTQSGS